MRVSCLLAALCALGGGTAARAVPLTPTTPPTLYPTLHVSTYLSVNASLLFYQINSSFSDFAASAETRTTIAMAVRSTFNQQYADKAPSAFVVGVPSVTEETSPRYAVVSAKVQITIRYVSEYVNLDQADAVTALKGTLSLAVQSGSFAAALQELALLRSDYPLTTVVFPTVPVYSPGFELAYVQTQGPSSRPSAMPSFAPTFTKRLTTHDSFSQTVTIAAVVSIFLVILALLLYAYFFSLFPAFVCTECVRKRVHDEVTRLKQLLPAPRPPPPSPPRELDPGPFAPFLGLHNASPPRANRGMLLLSERRLQGLATLKTKGVVRPDFDLPMAPTAPLRSQAAAKACLL